MERAETVLPDAPTSAHSEITIPYEFSAKQNEVLDNLGRAMRDVGRCLGVIGILSIIAGLARSFIGASSWQGAATAALWSLLLGAILLLIGIWTRDAGVHFRRVATTQGADIQNLMEALGEVRYIYGLGRVVIVVTLALVVLAMIVSLPRSAL